jgi:tryptophanase
LPGAGLHLELLRLAIPRRTYTESHLRYVADVFAELNLHKQEIPALRCTHMPEFLGHFQAKFELLGAC